MAFVLMIKVILSFARISIHFLKDFLYFCSFKKKGLRCFSFDLEQMKQNYFTFEIEDCYFFVSFLLDLVGNKEGQSKFLMAYWLFL